MVRTLQQGLLSFGLKLESKLGKQCRDPKSHRHRKSSDAGKVSFASLPANFPRMLTCSRNFGKHSAFAALCGH